MFPANMWVVELYEGVLKTLNLCYTMDSNSILKKTFDGAFCPFLSWFFFPGLRL